ncbi:UNVERIFIED_CONTAM: hypothetical protein K2H54_041918 [Gekko kuhli]
MILGLAILPLDQQKVDKIETMDELVCVDLDPMIGESCRVQLLCFSLLLQPHEIFVLKVLVSGAGVCVFPRLFSEGMRPRQWGIFKANTQEKWTMTPALRSGSRYDYTPSQMDPQQEAVDKGAWEERLAQVELGQVNMTRMLKKALMNIPRLAAQIVQGELHLHRLVLPVVPPPPLR